MSEPENLVLELLREMRARFDQVEANQIEHSKRFDQIDRELDRLAGYITFSIGKSNENRLELDQIIDDVRALEARIRGLETAD